MGIEIYTCDTQITKRDLGLTRDRFTQSILRKILEARTSRYWRSGGVFPVPPYLQRVINDFAEKRVAGALTNIQNYFARLSRGGFTPGGRRATNRPLLYLQNELLPSNEDIGALGEGVCGYYLENVESLSFMLRPFGVSPDMVFCDPATKEKILVEVKTSLHSGRISLKKAIALIAILAKSKFIRRGKYIGYSVQINIRSLRDFELYRLRMKEV